MRIYQQAQQPVRFESLGFGAMVAPMTMSKMKDIINASVRNYYVRRWAEKIVEGLDQDEDRVLTIYDWISRHTFYVKDPFDIELLKTPASVLQLIEIGEKPGLDCDDLTMLSLALLKSIGFQVAMRASSYSHDKSFSHIYGLVKIKGQWIPFDLVKNIGVGLEAPNPTRLYDKIA